MPLYFIGNREKRSVREPKAVSVLKQMEMGRLLIKSKQAFERSEAVRGNRKSDD